MNRPNYPTDLNDREWQLLEPLLPPPKPGGRPVKYPRREVVNAIRYVLRTGCSCRMLPHDLPPWRTAFDDHRLVANAGLILPVTLVQRLGLRELVGNHVDLGNAPGRANTGDKMLTLVASALAGGDCIDDADVLRTGGTADAIGGAVKAPSTLGTFLRSFRWGHVRQLDRVSRELLARAWAAGAGPGDGPLTIDLDSTICETYGLAKEGARHHV